MVVVALDERVGQLDGFLELFEVLSRHVNEWNLGVNEELVIRVVDVLSHAVLTLHLHPRRPNGPAICVDGWEDADLGVVFHCLFVVAAELDD